MTLGIQIDAVESERLREQERLDTLKTATERNIVGQFATPGPLALDIVRYALSVRKNPSPIRFLDPSIGTGAFLSALLKCNSSDLECAWGVEIDRKFVESAKGLWNRVPLQIIEGDFTKAACPLPQGFNFLIANPPYVRHHHLSFSDKARLQALASQVINTQVSGLSGLYCYFMLLGHKWLEPGGIAAWIVPSEFMDVNYGEALRQYLSTQVTLLRLHRFCASEAQFDDAMVTSAVVVFRNVPTTDNETAQFSYGGSLLRPDKAIEVAVSKLKSLRKWSAVLSDKWRQDDEVSASSRPTLGDFFRISRGIATGANDFFIVGRDEAASKGFEPRFLKAILPGARKIESNIIEADESGYPLLNPQLAVIDSDLAPEQLATESPSLWEYLRQGASAGVSESYLLQKRSPWYRQEQRAPAPFLCTYMARSRSDGSTFRFFWNHSKAIALNTYLMLYPVGALKTALLQNPNLASKVFDFLIGLEQRGFSHKGRVYGGGLFKMEPGELSAVDAEDLAHSLGLRISTQSALNF